MTRMKTMNSSIFDPGFYRRSHSDLSQFSDSQLWEHYVQFGLLEERIAHPHFSLSAYLRRYPDLRAANWIKGSHASALHHWNLYGKAEGRNASPEPGYPSASPLLHSDSNGYGEISVLHALRRVGTDLGQVSGKGVPVAIIDSGVQDGVITFWQNTQEVQDGIDNDFDGFVDNLSGWDFVDGDAIANDVYGHGTVVAQALATVAPEVEVMPLRMLTSEGYGTEARLIEAIDYAMKKNACIINLSLQIPHSVAIEAKLKAAVRQGIVICMAAGNDSKPSPGGVAAFADGIGALVVGCSAIASNRAGTVQNYVTGRGAYTSLATPLVSATAALILEANPELPCAAVIEILKHTASNILP